MKVLPGRLTQGIVLCAILFAVPLVGATVVALGDIDRALGAAQRERVGLARVAELRTLYRALADERRAANHLPSSPGPTSLDPAMIARLVGQIDREERALPLTGGAWAVVKAALPQRRRVGDERALFDPLVRAFARIADRSRLTYDPENAGVDLADAVTFRLPDAIELLGRTDVLVQRFLRTRTPSIDQRMSLTATRAEALGVLHFAFDDVAEAELLDPLIRTQRARLDAIRATTAYVTALDLVARADVTRPAAARRLDAAAQGSLDALETLAAALAPTHDRMISDRIRELERRRAFSIIPAVAGIAGTILLGILIARSMRHRAELANVHRASRRLAAEARFRAVFDAAALAIVVVGRSGVVCEANPAFDAMLGYGARALIGKRLSLLTDPDDRVSTFAQFEALSRGEIASYQYEKRYIHADGSLVWADVTVTSLGEDDPNDWFAIGVIEDITARRHIEQKLLYDATHDVLTGLANRSLFAARLDDVLSRRPDGTAAVVFIDLDHFKIVNDSLGHAAGDSLLCTVALRLNEFAGPGDTVARFGGDEFAVLFAELAHVADLTRRVKRIQERVAEPLTVDERSIYTTASIGVAPLTHRYTRAEDLLRDADTAMYRAKAEGRARAALFDHAMHEGAVRRLQLTSDLRAAIENGELRLAYQPIVRLSDRAVVGYEALMRWEHPRAGLLLPEDFIPLAEETGLIVPMGRWALGVACRRLAELRATGPAVAMHLNVSVQEIMQNDLAAAIQSELKATGVPPSALIVEITEHAIIESTRSSDAFLHNLRAIGVGIVIDDFGVGYSSLRYLHRFPISGLKIDRSFVNGVDEDLASEPIVRMLLELARTLGLDVVAEGVESEMQSASLQVLGCLYGQGYLFAMPEVPGVCV